MLLEINPLVLPDVGLAFWSLIAFLVLLFVLGKFAWKPIMKAIWIKARPNETEAAKPTVS